MGSNPLRNYNFRLVVGGVIQSYLQSVDTPEVSYAEHTHGTPGNSPDIKTAGKKIVGDLTFSHVIGAEGGDKLIWARFKLAKIAPAQLYKWDGFLQELGPDNITILNSFRIKGGYFSKIGSTALKTKSDESDNLMRDVTIRCDDFEMVA